MTKRAPVMYIQYSTYMYKNNYYCIHNETGLTKYSHFNKISINFSVKKGLWDVNKFELAKMAVTWLFQMLMTIITH